MSADGTGFAVLTTTVGDAEAATSLARALVEANLAACVQVTAVRSLYRWQGAVADEAEHRLDAKIAAAMFDAVAAFIRARHAYDTPEIVMVPVTAGTADYLTWLTASLQR